MNKLIPIIITFFNSIKKSPLLLSFLFSFTINSLIISKRAGVNFIDSLVQVISNFFGFIKLAFSQFSTTPNNIFNQSAQRIVYLRYAFQHILQWYVVFYILKNRKKYKISTFNYIIIFIVSLFILTDYDK